MSVCNYPDWHVDVSWRRALKRAFFTLSFGSTTMHMTHTELGHMFDNDMMAVANYVSYQTLASRFNVTSAAVLSVDKNLSDAREIVQKYAFMSLEQPDASTWLETLQLRHLDY